MTWRPPARDPYVDLADDAAQAAAIRARSEQRERRIRATEVATWVGTLRDLAERGTPCALVTAQGRTHRGRVLAVADDHVVVRTTAGTAVVAADLVRLVRPEPGQAVPPAMGDRQASVTRTMAEVLDRLLEADPAVAVVLRDVAEPYEGEVVGLGEDVLSLRLDAVDRPTVLIPVAALAEIITDLR